MWLYVPNLSTSSPSAPEEPDLISASSWQFQALEQSAWWRGKPSQSRHWYQRWSKATFIRLLCGLMPEPSTAARGVAQWTASLVASRASLTALPDESREATIPATSGPRLAALSSSQAHGSSSSKTSAACSRRGLTKSLARNAYSETFTSLVSRLREDCSRRQKSARAISANVSSSSQWPPPAARDHKGANGEAHLQNGSGRLHLDQLPNFVQFMWMTPRSHEVGQYQYSRGDKGKPVQTLTGQALDMEAYRASNTWPTPTAMNRPRSDETLEKCRTRRKEKAGQNTVPLYLEDLASRISLPVQRSETLGEKSSPDRRSLNPLFVEWLMGWPPGWTLLAWTDFACSATELSLFKQRMRSALLSLGLPREAPPAQLALFG